MKPTNIQELAREKAAELLKPKGRAKKPAAEDAEMAEILIRIADRVTKLEKKIWPNV